LNASGVVSLISENGNILNGNGTETNVEGSAVFLTASQGAVGTSASPITVVVPRIEGQATITIQSALGGSVLNPNFAVIDQSLSRVQTALPVEQAQAAATSASVLSALEEIGFIDWAGLDPDVRLVDCLEPCIKLPADQLEDEGMAGLREPTQMLVIRTIDGVKIIPVYVQTIAQRSPDVGSAGEDPVLN